MDVGSQCKINRRLFLNVCDLDLSSLSLPVAVGHYPRLKLVSSFYHRIPEVPSHSVFLCDG